MRVYQHPNGQKQMIDCDQEFVWVHPKAKKLDFGWSLVKDRLYSAKAKVADRTIAVDFSCPALEKPSALDLRHADRSVEYNRGWQDAIAHCYCPGATIEMASRVQAEARRLGL